MGDTLNKRQRYRCVAVRGKASKYQCVRCAENGSAKQACDWAHLHTETGNDPWADFVPLCRSCHKLYDSKPHTDETKAKMSAAQMGRKHSEETKAKLSAIRKGKPRSEEWKLRISEGMKASWARRMAERNGN